MAFLDRYDIDTSRPTVREAARDVARRTLLPALALWALVVGIGLLLVGPLDNLPTEGAVSRTLAAHRTPLWNGLTDVLTHMGGTEVLIGTCVVICGIIWWRTREWWVAIVPAIALATQAMVFITAAAVVGRDRPEVAHLDDAPPTSSYPSGHTGASLAFYLGLAMLAHRIANPVLRRLAQLVCLAIPLLIAYSRLYRGMHHLTDVLVGLLDGVVCALLAWNYLRRDEATPTAPTWSPQPGTTRA